MIVVIAPHTPGAGGKAITMTKHDHVEALPPYRALLVVDIRHFSGRRGRFHAELTDAVPQILAQAFQRAGLDRMWREHKFGATTGDGYVAGFPAEELPFLLNPFLPALQEELEYRNTVGWRAAGDEPLRMRVSVNVGPMTDSGGKALSEGSGASRVENHRLLDSDPVRDLLTRSGKPTCVAAIVSDRAFADAVATGYTAEDEDLYVRVPVDQKTYHGTAYLRVPQPSGDLLNRGFRAEADIDDEPTTQEAAPVNSTVIHQASGPVHTGSGNQFHGDGQNIMGYNSGSIQQSFGGRDR
ncbi:hypothetical protein [Amycolatopsis viridis]|uniref:Guanylate cyclase domain-containing protein n=1 Tax=Amycolatopsis viridis TaxID=185678 RepID=A0ABX0SPU3_9PSEU|nr:hypothetical protein [Amycolatopsis viridis]NIH78971.1 hypothetical protein [Amycolatopsis viridis]